MRWQGTDALRLLFALGTILLVVPGVLRADQLTGVVSAVDHDRQRFTLIEQVNDNEVQVLFTAPLPGCLRQGQEVAVQGVYRPGAPRLFVAGAVHPPGGNGRKDPTGARKRLARCRIAPAAATLPLHPVPPSTVRLHGE